MQKIEAAVSLTRESRKAIASAHKGLVAAQKRVANLIVALEKATAQQDAALANAEAALKAAKAAKVAADKIKQAKGEKKAAAQTQTA